MGRIQQSLNWNAPKVKVTPVKLTHEEFIGEVAKLGIARLDAGDAKVERLQNSKMVYGAGQKGLRGVTYFDKWLKDGEVQAEFIEVCSFGQHSPVQLAGTTLHELGHVHAGHAAGHAKGRKESCEKLGLRRVKAAGTNYTLAMFEPELRAKIVGLIDRLEFSRPNNRFMGIDLGGSEPKPCSMGVGTRGGKSRGAGSGSRLRKYVCACQVPQIVRASTDSLDATHGVCGSRFVLA